MKLSNLVLLFAVILVTVGCGKVPEAYQGKFEDKNLGVKLTLGAGEGALEFAGGRKLESTAQDYEFQAFVDGKTGIYVSTNPVDGRLVDIWWINPNLASKQTQEGFVWYQSEVIYSQFDAKYEGKVPSFRLVHCMDGMVMLDLATQRMQLGCPAGPMNYDFVRAKE